MQVAARRLSWCSPVQGTSWQHIAGRCQMGLRLGAEWGHCKASSAGLEAAPCTQRKAVPLGSGARCACSHCGWSAPGVSV